MIFLFFSMYIFNVFYVYFIYNLLINNKVSIFKQIKKIVLKLLIVIKKNCPKTFD